MTKGIIKGKNIILCPLSRKDLPAFVRWMNDKQVTQYLAFSGRATRVKELIWLKKVQQDKDSYYFGITAKEGKVIGNVSLKLKPPHRQGNVGICIGERSEQNKGYGTEAMKLLLAFGFKRLKLQRIDLNVFTDNARAIKVYQRIGFKLEGRLRQSFLKNGRLRDQYLMAILKPEWNKTNSKS